MKGVIGGHCSGAIPIPALGRRGNIDWRLLWTDAQVSCRRHLLANREAAREIRPAYAGASQKIGCWGQELQPAAG